MAGVKISDLPAATSAGLGDLLPTVQSGTTVKVTDTQVMNLIAANITIAESQVTNLVADLGNKINRAGDTMSGALYLYGPPVLPTEAADKAYVDAVATGLVIQPSVVAASTVNLNVTYANGAAGVGATLTNAGALASFTVDGVIPVLNDRILIKDQTAQLQNGIYTVTNVGSISVAWVLTRATDFDTPPEIKPGDLVIVTGGTTNANSSYIETATITAVGTSPIVFVLFTASPGNYLRVPNNLSDVASASTARTNLGLGNAAVKAVTDNTKSVVPSLNSAPTVINNITTFADTLGTVKDSGVAISTFITGGIKSIQVRKFLTSQTYSAPVGLMFARVEIVGGGGGGGGTSATDLSSYAASPGGGGGGYASRLMPAATIGASQLITIAAGGSAGVAAFGGTGGTSSFGALLSASGGAGGGVSGSAPAPTTFFLNGGGGGFPSAADIGIQGQQGHMSFGTPTAGYLTGGGGGMSHLGMGASDGLNTQNGFAAANNTGGGGGGGSSLQGGAALSGGPGGSGICIVTEYLSL